MIETFHELHYLLTAIALSTPRLFVAFTVMPVFNPQLINGIVKNCIVLAFSLIIYPTVHPYIRSHEISLLLVSYIMIKEAIIGLLIGYLVGLFFSAVEAVGGILDIQRGASFASLMNPATGTQTSPLGSLFSQFAILLFFATGGFSMFLSGIYESYRLWPILSFWPTLDTDFAPFFLGKLDDMMMMAFILSAPILIALFLSELGLGLINRFAPQLNVFFLSMPIKSALAIFLLTMYMQVLLSYLRDRFALQMDVLNMVKQVIQ